MAMQHFLLSAASRTLTLKAVFRMGAVPFGGERVGTLATIHADEGSGWDALHAGSDTRRVNHSVAFMDEGVCTNQAETGVAEMWIVGDVISQPPRACTSLVQLPKFAPEKERKRCRHGPSIPNVDTAPCRRAQDAIQPA